MLPKAGRNVKLTNRFLIIYPTLSHLKDIMLTIMKLDLLKVHPTEYEIYFSDGSYIYNISIDGVGQFSGVNVFETWVFQGSLQDPDVEEEEELVDAIFEPVEQEPRNNDGRHICYWCGSPTKSVPGASFNSYDICTNSSCGK